MVIQQIGIKKTVKTHHMNKIDVPCVAVGNCCRERIKGSRFAICESFLRNYEPVFMISIQRIDIYINCEVNKKDSVVLP